MRAIKKIIAIVYLLAAAALLAAVGIVAFAPCADDFLYQLERFPLASGIVCAVCLGIVALGALVGFCRLFFSRREPDCVRSGDTEGVEVSLAAIESCARMAAPGDDDVMIENVEGRAVGGGRSSVKLKIEVIAFTDTGLGELGARIRDRVVAACGNMIGSDDVTALVRFLPAKTTVHTVEVSDE